MSEALETIGPYKIFERLGEGGEGIVYRAAAADGTPVALKTVRVLRQELFESLRREIHALARIRHPGVVRIVEHGVREGVPWYAMELVQGPTLRAWARELQQRGQAGAGTDETRTVRAGAAPESAPGAERRDPASLLPPLAPQALLELLGVARRLCTTLAYVHGEGLVHRDLKPSNILITNLESRMKNGELKLQSNGRSEILDSRFSILDSFQPVLVDFGLSAQFAAELGREALQSGGTVSGTVAYMAPEQALGEFVDARADLYALGCILYELLCGRPPFVGRTAGEVLRKHLTAEPLRPSQLRAGLPPALEELLLQLLAKEPRRRLGHADDVAAALKRLGALHGFEGTLAPLPRAYLYRPGFSGRGALLGRLEQAAASARAGRGAVVLLGGESGAGKTRLAMEAAKSAQRRGLEVLLGECQPGGGPLGALRSLLQAVTDRCRERGESETGRLLGARGKLLAAYEPALCELPGQQAWPEPVELPPDAARLRLFGALADLLGALCADRALLLVLDDLQWADELTLGLLEHLLAGAWLERLRLLVLGTYRSEEAGALLVPLLGKPGVEHLELGRLDEASVGAMVGDMLALEPAPQSFAQFLARQSEGNPFFVAEYLRTAVAEGLLWRNEQGRWQVAEPGEGRASEAVYEALPLPGSVRELVGRRLEGLDAAVRRVAEAAAILGRELDLALLRRVARAGQERLAEALQTLLARQVLEQTEAGQLRFVHDKIREVAEARLDPVRRRRLHRAAAVALEKRGPAGNDQLQAALGRHWEQAGEPDRAWRCFLRAARLALARHGYVEAEALYRGSLRCALEPSREAIEARIELASEVLHVRGARDEAIEQLEWALAEARKGSERLCEERALRGLGKLHWRAGRFGEARDCLEQACQLAAALADSSEQALLLSNLAILWKSVGQFEEAEACLKRSSEIARSIGDRASIAFGLSVQADIEILRGAPVQAVPLHEQALELLRRLGERRLEANTLCNLAIAHAELDNVPAAISLFEQALSLQRQMGDRVMEASTLGNLGTALVLLDRLAEARRCLEEAQRLEGRNGSPHGAAVLLGELARLDVLEGQPEPARERYRQALELHRRIGDRAWEGVVLLDRAVLERCSGQFDQAAALLAAAEPLLRASGRLGKLLQCLCECGHLALALRCSPAEALREATALAARLAGKALQPLARLERACTLAAAGEEQRLVRGALVEDLPAGLRRWLVQTGQLAEPVAPGAPDSCHRGRPSTSVQEEHRMD